MLPLIMAALGLLQDQQKKQAAAKQGQVDAANNSLIGGISDMPAPAASGGGQPAPGAGLGSLVGIADKLGAEKPAASGAAPAAPLAGPGGGKLDIGDPYAIDEENPYGPLGGGASGNALKGR